MLSKGSFSFLSFVPAQFPRSLRQTFKRHGEQPRDHGDRVVLQPGILRERVQPDAPGKGLREPTETVEVRDDAGSDALQGAVWALQLVERPGGVAEQKEPVIPSVCADRLSRGDELVGVEVGIEVLVEAIVEVVRENPCSG